VLQMDNRCKFDVLGIHNNFLSSAMLSDFYKTSVGKKIVMASSGIVLVAFVFGHMVGNLKLFSGRSLETSSYKIDEYAEFLRTFAAQLIGEGSFLWMVRLGLLGCLVVHAVSGIQLSILHRKSKPVSSYNPKYATSNAASRSMIYGGLFLLFFVVVHILHLTTGHLNFSGFQEGKVYSNLYLAFQSLPVVVFYLLAMIALTMHLYHGTWSMFQTLGMENPVWNLKFKSIAKILAIVLFLGFSSVPLGIYVGIVQEPIDGRLVTGWSE